MSKRKILLLEPNYKNKYPPMGLMKLATYYRCCRDDVRFYKGDLKNLVAGLLFEDFFNGIDLGDSVDMAIYSFVTVRGSSDIVEYIKTGKYAPLDLIAAYSTSLDGYEDLSKEDFADRLFVYRERYRQEDYPKFDRVCVTTLFTFYWKETIDTINFAKKMCKPKGKVYVGGIAASLVPEHIEAETGIKPHIGAINKANTFEDKEQRKIAIDELPLDYSILEEIDYRYPTENAYFGYMTRGCVNNCPFCVVPRLEPQYRSYISIKEKIKKIDNCFGAKRDLLLMDNNVFASNCFNQIIDEIKACGFANGATYVPANEYDITFRNLQEGFALGESKSHKVYNDRAYIKKMVSLYDTIAGQLHGKEKGDFYRVREELELLFHETATKENVAEFDEIAREHYNKLFKHSSRVRFIDFNQGLDVRRIDKAKISKLAETAIRPLRIAFDFWSMHEKYVKSVKLAASYGIKNLSNYLLYNFKDEPYELYERLNLNVRLCIELDISIYSFPMKYHPIDDPAYFRNRDYVGKHWNRKFIRAVQAVLNSTHGKIGRGETFFKAAFGNNLDEYYKILWMPEALIIQRYKYDKDKRLEYYGKGQKTPYDNVDNDVGSTTKRWWRCFNALSPKHRAIAEGIIKKNNFFAIDIDVYPKPIRDVLQYYKITRDTETE